MKNLDKVLTELKVYLSDENLKLVEQIITGDTQKIEQLKPHENISNLRYTALFDNLYKLKVEEDIIRVIIDCFIKISGRLEFFRHHLVEKNRIEKLFTEEELIIYYAINVSNLSCNTLFFNKALELDKSTENNGELFQKLYDEFCLLEDNFFKFNGKIVLLCLMLKNAELVKKYDIVTNLEKMVSEYFLTLVGKSEEVIADFNNFDINKDDVKSLDKVIDLTLNRHHVKSKFNSKVIALVIINNFIDTNLKSEYLEKYALMLLYTKALETLSISGGEVNLLVEGEIDEELKIKIKAFILKYPQYKFVLNLSLQNEILEDLIQWNLITLDEYFDYISNNELTNYWVDFLRGENDTIDNKKFYCISFEESFKIKKILGFSKYFKDNQELQKRVKLLELICSDEKANWLENLITCSTLIKEYKLSANYVASVIDVVSIFIEKQVKKELKAKNYDCDLFNATSKFIVNNQEYIDYVVEEYCECDAICKSMILLGISSDIKYLDQFLKINDMSKAQSDVTMYIYQQNKELAEKILPLLNSKKLAERKNAFVLLSKAYGNEYITQINQAFEIEKNEKLKDEMELFILSNK